MNEHVAQIVAAYVKKHQVAASELPALIASVNQALTKLGQPPEPEALPGRSKPAVPVRRSVDENSITCLICGRSGRMLKRHLSSAHNLTPAEYRERWRLPPVYPMSATGYSARRSELAKAIGLGKPGSRGGRRRGTTRATHL